MAHLWVRRRHVGLNVSWWRNQQSSSVLPFDRQPQERDPVFRGAQIPGWTIAANGHGGLQNVGGLGALGRHALTPSRPHPAWSKDSTALIPLVSFAGG